MFPLSPKRSLQLIKKSVNLPLYVHILNVKKKDAEIVELMRTDRICFLFTLKWEVFLSMLTAAMLSVRRQKVTILVEAQTLHAHSAGLVVLCYCL